MISPYSEYGISHSTSSDEAISRASRTKEYNTFMSGKRKRYRDESASFSMQVKDHLEIVDPGDKVPFATCRHEYYDTHSHTCIEFSDGAR